MTGGDDPLVWSCLGTSCQGTVGLFNPPSASCEELDEQMTQAGVPDTAYRCQVTATRAQNQALGCEDVTNILSGDTFICATLNQLLAEDAPTSCEDVMGLVYSTYPGQIQTEVDPCDPGEVSCQSVMGFVYAAYPGQIQTGVDPCDPGEVTCDSIMGYVYSTYPGKVDTSVDPCDPGTVSCGSVVGFVYGTAPGTIELNHDPCNPQEIIDDLPESCEEAVQLINDEITITPSLEVDPCDPDPDDPCKTLADTIKAAGTGTNGDQLLVWQWQNCIEAINECLEGSGGQVECEGPVASPYLAQELAQAAAEYMPWVENYASFAIETRQETMDTTADTEENAGSPPKTRRCKTKESDAGGGAWNIDIPAKSIDALPESSAERFAGLGTISLDIPDVGTTSQKVCYEPGGLTFYAETREPPTGGEKAKVLAECGLAVIGGGLGTAGTGGIAFYAAAAAVLVACGTAGWVWGDTGYMHCKGTPSPHVWWGGNGGNSYVSELAQLGVGGIVSLSASSQGPGETKTVPVSVGYDDEGYEEGLNECQSEQRAGRERAWELYQHWGETHSERDTGTASIDLVVTPTATSPVDATLKQVGAGLFLDSTGETLFVGCETSACDFRVKLIVSACGQQVITPGSGAVKYEFKGLGGCIDITVKAGDETVSLDVPLASLNLDSDSSGPTGQLDRTEGRSL